ncbi:cisplatin damage response ATP-dependent DNA ligase [bacterium]|nr:cisplatin damage response ATP-dependent DNA ligase [bacterium]
MKAFATLLDSLSYTGSTLDKRRLMADYFLTRPAPERGWALAALAGTLTFPVAKSSLVREIAMERVDPVLLSLSRDYVGDLAETVALIWPGKIDEEAPGLPEIVQELGSVSRAVLRIKLPHWLDRLDANGRWALLKLITGNIRIGVSARLAKTALADAFAKDVDEIEQIWHGVQPPYQTLFDWLEDKSDKPEFHRQAFFMPMMLSHPIEEDELSALPLDHYQVELKWDGIRVQLVRAGDNVAIYSRTGDDITHSFPDIASVAQAMNDEEFVLDGELLTTQDGEVASFNSLQQRLNRKLVSPSMLTQYPAHIRLYDILVDAGEDVRSFPLSQRRKRLEAWYGRNRPTRMDVSEVLAVPDHISMASLRHAARHEPRNGVEGLMIKRLDSPYIAGRPRGHWFKWKRQTQTLDCVLLYAQRGSGKRSSFYSDYTFGVWNQEQQLVPIGKAYSGFTDAELGKLDKWIRANTSNRFGPVREVKHDLVLEIEFDSIHPSNRHKSGLAMRFPRVHRIRWDKPAHEADTLENAQKLAV